MWETPGEGEPSMAERLAGSIMEKETPAWDSVEPAMFGNLDDLAMIGPAAKGLLGLAALGMVKPTGKIPISYVPELVKQAQKRVVEPVFTGATRTTWSPRAQTIASQAAKLTPEELLAFIRTLSEQK